jgi:hypothetical protein
MSQALVVFGLLLPLALVAIILKLNSWVSKVNNE